jgi:hypothetical protein
MVVKYLLFWKKNINYKCLEMEYSEKYLEPRRIKEVTSLENYIMRNFVVYTDNLILLRQRL